MVRKLTPHGDGMALILDPSTLAELNITPDTALELRTEDGWLVVRPLSEDDSNAHLATSEVDFDRIGEKHGVDGGFMNTVRESVGANAQWLKRLA